MMGRLKNESGFALILTLVITALIVAIAVEMIHQVYVDTTISRGFRDGQQASILAESGVMAVKTALSMPNVDPNLLAGFLAKPLSDEVGTLGIEISDESSKININGLVSQNGDYDELIKNALLRLTARLKLQEDTWSNVLDSVADWIDVNDAPRSGGAETLYYRTLKPSYTARNGRLMTLTELSLVKGIKPVMLESFVDEEKKSKLRDCLTIYSNPLLPLINVNTASKAVLMALDARISESVANQIINTKNKTNTRRFDGVGDFPKVKELNDVYYDKNSWGARLTTTSNLYRITAVARVKESVRTVEAVVSGGMVLSWQEY